MVKGNSFYPQLFLVCLCGMALNSCKPKEKLAPISPGEINLQQFVAIGDGNTAGYMDDALYLYGQQNSLGAILQTQLQLVGAGEIYLPLMGGANIGTNSSFLSRLILGWKTDCLGGIGLSPVRFAQQGEVASLTTSVYSSQNKYSNFGVPGLRMIDMVSTAFGNINLPQHNAFFARMSKDQFTWPVWSGAWSSVQENIFDGGYPTFCSIYLGIEDVLPYARSGATQNPMSPLAGFPGVGFEESLTQLWEQLYSQNVNAVVATIPDITQMPYFTTIPYNGLNLDEANAASLNQIYGPLGFSFTVGSNSFMIEDPTAGAFGVRPMVEGELILLNAPLDSMKCHQYGSVYPLRDEFVLTLAELQEIRNQILAYNQVIRQYSNFYGFAIAETGDFYTNLSDGFVYNGVTMSSKFVSGGAYSLDGIHLNPRGNAMLANVFINAINKKYKATIPFANALSYSSIYFP
jgi:hypothetical protein